MRLEGRNLTPNQIGLLRYLEKESIDIGICDNMGSWIIGELKFYLKTLRFLAKNGVISIREVKGFYRIKITARGRRLLNNEEPRHKVTHIKKRKLKEKFKNFKLRDVKKEIEERKKLKPNYIEDFTNYLFDMPNSPFKTKPQAHAAVKRIFNFMIQSLINGDDVRILNFGTFTLDIKPSREFFSPLTKQDYVLPPKAKILFNPSTILKAQVQQALEEREELKK